MSRLCLRNGERITQLSVLETELRGSYCISTDQKSKDLRPIKNITMLINSINHLKITINELLRKYNHLTV